MLKDFNPKGKYKLNLTRDQFIQFLIADLSAEFYGITVFETVRSYQLKKSY